MIAGRPLASFRGTRPLLQGYAYPCRSGLVPRKGRKAAPVHRFQASSSASSSRTMAFTSSRRLMYFQSASSM
ncbi:hypothetical protein EI693_22495 [Pseudomonas oryziphila]|uniref:DUF1534 domain-containing protein n=1 Tax=Pseudomonas oryziphila TaxID=2894079 RepID=A0ABM7CW16_9PSED|nr:hypothetical protein EI693_22495 [Pseudomonas oryziphila]